MQVLTNKTWGQRQNPNMLVHIVVIFRLIVIEEYRQKEVFIKKKTD